MARRSSTKKEHTPHTYQTCSGKRRLIADVRTSARRVIIAGRVVTRDVYKGQSLLVVADESGTITCVFDQDISARVHDIVECTGFVRKHRLHVESMRVLVPSRRAPESKQQWEQLISDPSRKEKLVLRSSIIGAIRTFFQKRKFLEVDTPSLVPAPGMEPHLSPFKTELETASGKCRAAYLITSPEYAMKKLLSAGFEKIYDLARVYRNAEELGGAHNPEFLMLEWYRAYASYYDIMDDAEAMLRFVAKTVFGTTKINYHGKTIDLSLPWERMTVAEAFWQYAGIDLEKISDREGLLLAVRKKGYRPKDDERFEDIFFRVFLNEVEPCLGQRRPTILMEYPAQLAALARSIPDEPSLAERFELYIAGIELANAFGELNDPVIQKKRLQDERTTRKQLKKTALPIDQDFLDALETGMPPAAGIALGVDRLVMLLTDSRDINEVRYFPAAAMFPESKRRKAK